MGTGTEKICRVAIDAMGGDVAPENPVLGAIAALKENKNIKIILVGDETKIREICVRENFDTSSIEIVHTDQIIDMSDSPTASLKSKPNSSIVIGARLVKDKKADAFISAGNTGAMMAASTLIIGRIKGIGRPTIGTPLPNERGGFTFVFDAGASVDCKPMHLLEYSLLSTIFLKEIYGIKNPSVGLLSVGEEEEKGNELTHSTFKLLKDAPVNFIGNVEGRDILKGKSDIVVCDGFVGNIILKFAESMLGLLRYKFKAYAKQGFIKSLKILFAKGTVKSALTGLDYQEYGGVPLLGINGISIIGHGSSTPKAMKNMILRADEMHQSDLISKFEEKLDEYKEFKQQI